MSKTDKWVQCDVEVLVETETAFRFLVAGESVWIPKSQMKHVADVELAYHESPEAIQIVVMKEWIANKVSIEGSCEPFEAGAEVAEMEYSDFPEDRGGYE